MTTLTHDFHDGRGPVPAHQHLYGGGWVADSAHVDASVRVAGDAQVSGDAWVYGNAAINILTALCYCLTIHADSKIKMRFSVGCFSGSRKEFVAKAKAEKVPLKAINAVLALADATIKGKP